MADDVSAEVAGLISEAKVYGASENIRHGKYKFVIRRIHAQKVETDQGLHKFAFFEVSPLVCEPNPQTEGDHVDYPGTAGPLKDDGRNPNPVGSYCAMKVDFDGPGGRSAGANIKDAVLGLFGKNDGEISNDEINKTWIDLARVKAVKKGEPVGFDATTNQVIIADRDKAANPACGMVIACRTFAKKKKTPNDKGAYITKLIWECVSPPGTGENTPELVAARRAEIEKTFAEEEEETTAAGGAAPSTPANPFAGAPSAPAPAAPVAPATTPAAPVAAAPPPPAPPTTITPPAPWSPPAPWRAHPTSPGWYWDGGQGVKSEAQLRSGQ